MVAPKTLFEKIWNSHLVDVQADGTCLLYIDRHLTHEVTTPQPTKVCARQAAACVGLMQQLL